ncbi:MAG: Helix-turn-helix domain [Neobacillus sp.]|nr:Helix-turn-helix domain [Neobacillus sp.]
MKILSEKELASELGLSQWTVRTLRLQRGLPHFRTSGRIFYRLESVISWMDKQEESEEAPRNAIRQIN